MATGRPRLGSWALILAVAWSAFAFGAVYPWAYRLLAAGIFALAAIEGVLLLRRRQRGASSRPGLTWLGATFALFCAAIAVQLIPIDNAVIRERSPARARVLEQSDVAYALAGTTPGATHALSVAPPATVRGLLFVLLLGATFFAARQVFRREGVSTFVAGLAATALGLIVVAAIQRASFNGKIYGFWTPLSGGFDPYGPFINHNHFAGWMLLATPVLAGAWLARLERVTVPGNWRRRILWLGSPAASKLVMLGFLLLLSAASIVLSFSRSGITSLAGALALLVVGAARRGARRYLTVSFLTALAVLAFLWAGQERVVDRFAATADEYPFRVGIWRDTLRIIADMPLAGTGLNTFGVVSPLYQTSELTYHFNEAHSDYLQLASEGGALLLAPAALLATAFMLAAQRSESGPLSSLSWFRFGAKVGIAALAVQSLVEFSVQIPANLLLLGMVAALAVSEPPAGEFQ